MRRFSIFPLIIVLVALGIAWWSRSRGLQHDADATAFAQAVVDAVVADPPRRPDLRGTDALLRDEVARRLAAVGNAVRAGQGMATVTVVRGDDTPRADGSATHTATVRIGDEVVLVLRLRHDGDAAKIGIVGVVGGPAP